MAKKRQVRRNGPKVTAAGKALRVYQIVEAIIKGVVRRRDLMQYTAKTHGWKVSDRQFDVYLKEATDWFKKNSEIDRGKELGKALAQCDDLYRMAREVTIAANKNGDVVSIPPDLKAALAILRERATLAGIRVERIEGEMTGKFDVRFNEAVKGL